MENGRTFTTCNDYPHEIMPGSSFIPCFQPSRRVAILGTWMLLLVPGGCGDSKTDTEAGSTVSSSSEENVHHHVEAARKRLTQNEGGRRVLRAIEAHGELRAWYRAPTSSYTWEYANKGADLRFESFLVVDNRTRRAYHNLLRVGTYDNAQSVDARFAWDGERAWIAPDSLQQPNPRF